MAKYSKKTQKKVAETMHEFKQGKLKSGGSHKKVTNPRQAIAIALEEAREEGERVPEAPKKNRKSRASVMKKSHRSKTTSPLKQRKGQPEKKGSKQPTTKPGRNTKRK